MPAIVSVGNAPPLGVHLEIVTMSDGIQFGAKPIPELLFLKQMSGLSHMRTR
jgi:hypothetical protein